MNLILLTLASTGKKLYIRKKNIASFHKFDEDDNNTTIYLSAGNVIIVKESVEEIAAKLNP